MNTMFKHTNITSGFLKDKQKLNRKTTINAIYDRFFETGRFDALECKWTPESTILQRPHIFWDSDVAKWIEAASYIIAKNPDEALEKKIEDAIDSIEKNQLDDGYFNSYYITSPEEKRFTKRGDHELYCAGHLIEAAIAYYYATGKDRFLKIMEKYADLIDRIFVKEHTASFDTPGHEEIEIALIKLYKCTGKKKYLDMCRYFLLTRGNSVKDGDTIYDQSNTDLYNISSAVGHCVRACYLFTAMAEYAQEANDEKMMESCRRVFDDIVNSKMYITGGIGSTYIGEAFTIPYNLPSETSYAETCASIALMFFAQKMLNHEAKGIYADIIEKTIYNSILSGLSLDGEKFFYENALEINTSNEEKNNSTPTKERFPASQRLKVFSCSCCPPNVSRVLATLENYIYHYSNGTYFIDQFCTSEFNDGNIIIKQKTEYPVNGKVKITFDGVKKAAIRIPSWCDNFSIDAEYKIKDGYAYIKNPTCINFDMELIPKLYASNEEVNDCANKTALLMGPVVYCAERIDNPVNLHRLYIDKNLTTKVEFDKEFGLYTIVADGYIRKTSIALYENLSEKFEKTKIRLIPYYSFANRGKSDMLIWMNYR